MNFPIFFFFLVYNIIVAKNMRSSAVQSFPSFPFLCRFRRKANLSPATWSSSPKQSLPGVLRQSPIAPLLLNILEHSVKLVGSKMACSLFGLGITFFQRTSFIACISLGTSIKWNQLFWFRELSWKPGDTISSQVSHRTNKHTGNKRQRLCWESGVGVRDNFCVISLDKHNEKRLLVHVSHKIASLFLTHT